MGAIKMAVIFVVLFPLVQLSMSLKTPLLSVIGAGKMRTDDTSSLAIITTSEAVEKALNDTGAFAQTSYVDLYARRFVVGTIYGAPVVYVRTPNHPPVHAGITVHLMADNFNISGVIVLGTAGATNESLAIGSVSVPKHIIYTGFWNWLSKDSSVKGELDVGEFNYPVNGENLLGSIQFKNISFIYKGKINEGSAVNPTKAWLKLANKIQLESVDVVVGLNSSCSEIYINNPAYREFLYKTFRASTVDTTSAAIALGARGHNVGKFIYLQGISNYAGAGNSTKSASALASKNVVSAGLQFIEVVSVPTYDLDEDDF